MSHPLPAAPRSYSAYVIDWVDACFAQKVWQEFAEDEQVRARTVFAVLVFSSISIGISAFIMSCLSLLQVRNLWIGVMFCVVVSLLMAGTAMDFRKRGKISLAANVFAFLMFVSIGSAFAVTGGMHSPVAFLLLAVPVSIFMVAGRKSAIVWSVVTFAFYLGISFANLSGVNFVQIMRPENLEVVMLSLWYLSAIIIIGFLVLYERIMSGLTTAIQKEKIRLHEEAEYDSLTGFLNRDSFQKQFEENLHQLTQSGGRLALLRVDLLNVKTIVAQLGYDAGDELVREFANACRRALGDLGHAGRFASGEFCLLLPQVADRGQVISLIVRIQRECGSHLCLADGVAVPVLLRVGGVLAPDFSVSGRSLMRGAQDAVLECDALNERFVLR